MQCPICESRYVSRQLLSEELPQFDRRRFDCEVCGVFDLSNSLCASDTKQILPPNDIVRRAAISHWLRVQSSATSEPPYVDTSTFELICSNTRRSSIAEQVANFIRFLGNQISKSGEPIDGLQPALYAHIGAPSPRLAGEIVSQLIELNLIRCSRRWDDPVLGQEFVGVDLSIAGWERYESERIGKVSGKYAFLALQFNDEHLDKLVAEVIKPEIKLQLDYDLVDMRDAAQAGIIDNIMRQRIRDAAFVIVDLTHDNPGAYWESGFAEGLGKPVIYICEDSKFQSKKTHFDTNHCTTVMWEMSRIDEFRNKLIATIQRSLLPR